MSQQTVRKRNKAGAPAGSVDAEAAVPDERDVDYDAGKTDQGEEDLTMARIQGSDWGMLGFFGVLAVLTRFWRIEVPQGIVWDETHFTKFLTWYFTGHYFVDIHPPMAKMFHAWVLATFTDYVGPQEVTVEWWTDRGFIGTTDWKKLYEDAYGAPYWVIRCSSAVFGVLIVLVAYLAARWMGCGRVAAFVCGWLMLLENLVLLQSRLILTDIFLYFFNMLTYAMSFASARRFLSPTEQVAWIVATGVALGGAVSVKYTALGTIGLVGVHQAFNLSLILFERGGNAAKRQSSRKKRDDGDGDREDSSSSSMADVLPKFVATGLWKASTILGIAGVIFIGFWFWHMSVLPFDGQGTGFMNDEFKQTLVPKLPPEMTGLPKDACPNHANAWSDCGWPAITKQECEQQGCCYDPTSPRNWCYHRGTTTRKQMPLVKKFREMFRATWANNGGEGLMKHPHMSEWWEWPTMDCRLIPFGHVSPRGRIISVGNPFIWWSVPVAFVLSFSSLVLYIGRNLVTAAAPLGPDPATVRRCLMHATLCIGYVGNIVPYIMIPRSKFNYHYVPALEVGMLIVTLVIDDVMRFADKPHVRRVKNLIHLAVLGYIVLILASFIYWAPWTYGTQLTTDEHYERVWVKKWGANHLSGHSRAPMGLFRRIFTDPLSFLS